MNSIPVTQKHLDKDRDWRRRSQQAARDRARQAPYRPPVHTPASVVNLVIIRSNRMAKQRGLDPLPRGRCELCGKPATNTHTRRPDGSGGTTRPENRLASNKIRVCGHGNVSGCHARIELNRAWAREHGLLLWQTQNPAEEQVDLLAGRVLLTDDGHYQPDSRGKAA